MATKFTLGLEEFDSQSKLPKSNLWRSIIAEFVGIFILNFFSCAACTQSNNNFVLIALAFGLSVFAAASTIGHISGCHINPAITFGFLIAEKISFIRAMLYIIAQCSGAVTAVFLLKSLIQDVNGTEFLGHTVLNPALDPLQGAAIEFFLGFLLVLVVFGVTDGNKPDSRFLAPLAIGLTVTLGHLSFVGYTSSSMNPARTFGTAFVTGNWNDHWVYWVGPIFGGCVASLLYTFVFSAPKRSDNYLAVRETEDKEMTTNP